MVVRVKSHWNSLENIISGKRHISDRNQNFHVGELTPAYVPLTRCMWDGMCSQIGSLDFSSINGYHVYRHASKQPSCLLKYAILLNSICFSVTRSCSETWTHVPLPLPTFSAQTWVSKAIPSGPQDTTTIFYCPSERHPHYFSFFYCVISTLRLWRLQFLKIALCYFFKPRC